MVERLHRKNIEIVLVEPQNAGNVGAAARALYNMGLDRLALVGWIEDIESRRVAYEWATDGEQILKKARRCSSLEQALAKCTLAVATSARQGSDRPPSLGRADFIALLERWTPSNRVAIVFGPERTGLRTEHVRLCSHTLMLPTAPGCTSLNLAQAVLLVGYEILLASGGADEGAACCAPTRRPVDRVATRGERQRLYEHACQALKAVGFLRPRRPIRPLDEIGYLLDRAATTSHEVKILHGMCRKILWAAGKKQF
jgi:TrmH family RNA methyltransferase